MTIRQTSGETTLDGNRMGDEGLNRRWAKWLRPLWIIVAATALTLFIIGIPTRSEHLLQTASTNERLLADLGLSADFLVAYLTALDLILVFTHFFIATVIFWRGSESPMAVLVAITLVTAPFAATQSLANPDIPWSLLGSFIIYLGLTSSISLLYLFPDGHFVPRWTRPTTILWAALNFPVVFLTDTWLSLTTLSSTVQSIMLLLFSVSGVYAQVYRYLKVSTPRERQQTKWAVLGLVAAAATPLAHYLNLLTLPSVSQAKPPTLFYNLADPAVFQFATIIQLIIPAIITLVLLLFPISFAIAILRYRLFDVEIVINRTLVYGSMTALIIGLYVLIVGGLGALFQTQGNVILAIIATGLIAILFDPLRARLQRGVNRLMYGDRDDPVAVLSELGKRLEKTTAPETTLPIIVESIQQSLKLEYVAIALKDTDHVVVAAEAGQKKGNPQKFPLTYQSETIGDLMVTSKAIDQGLSPAEQRLLKNLARQAGPAVHAVQLTADLQRSRERLVTTREEERRRIRRDLHDDLGPQLATMTLKIDTARNLIRKDPEAANQILVELKEQSGITIAGIRRLVNDLRPPELDQLGLISALKERAASQGIPNGISITIESAGELPPLPAAVEVAAYRITMEAMMNVIRHAKAKNCIVHLQIDHGERSELLLDISDDGRGLPDDYEAGVGLVSMGERAAELGGRCTITATPGDGTRVSARLPIIYAM